MDNTSATVNTIPTPSTFDVSTTDDLMLCLYAELTAHLQTALSTDTSHDYTKGYIDCLNHLKAAYDLWLLADDYTAFKPTPEIDPGFWQPTQLPPVQIISTTKSTNKGD